MKEVALELCTVVSQSRGQTGFPQVGPEFHVESTLRQHCAGKSSFLLEIFSVQISKHQHIPFTLKHLFWELQVSVSQPSENSVLEVSNPTLQSLMMRWICPPEFIEEQGLKTLELCTNCCGLMLLHVRPSTVSECRIWQSRRAWWGGCGTEVERLTFVHFGLL